MYNSFFFNNDVEYDSWSDEEKYEVRIDMPGVSKDKVDVYAENNKLDISWERDKEGGIRKNIYGKKSISFKLPNDIQVSKIKSSLDNGVLKINLPRSNKHKPKKIPVLTE